MKKISILYFLMLFVSTMTLAQGAYSNWLPKQKGKYHKVQFSRNGDLNSSAKQRLNSITFQSPLPDDQWQTDGVYDFSYNANQLDTFFTISDAFNGTWSTAYTARKQYDAIGRTTSYEQMETAQGPLTDLRYQYQYNAAGNLTQTTSYLREASTQQWIPDVKTLHITGSNNLNTMEIDSTWDKMMQQWTIHAKREYVYDGSNNTIQVDYSWFNPGEGWSAITRMEQTFSAADQLLSTVFSQQQNGAWLPQHRYNYNYDNQELAAETYFEWIDNTWAGVSQYKYFYDNASNLTDVITLSPDPVGNDWVQNLKTTYTYNNNYASIDLVTPSMLITSPLEFRHQTVRADFFAHDGVDWQLAGRGLYAWSTTESSSTKNLISNLALQLSPNPATDQVNLITDLPLDDATLTLTNLAGQIVLRQDLYDQKAIEVGHLQNGFYFYQVSSPKTGIASGKVVIEK